MMVAVSLAAIAAADFPIPAANKQNGLFQR